MRWRSFSTDLGNPRQSSQRSCSDFAPVAGKSHQRQKLTLWDGVAKAVEAQQQWLQLVHKCEKLLLRQEVPESYDNGEKIMLSHLILVAPHCQAKFPMKRHVGHVHAHAMVKQPLSVSTGIPVKHADCNHLLELTLVDVVVLLCHGSSDRGVEAAVQPRDLTERHGSHGRPKRDIPVPKTLVDDVRVVRAPIGNAIKKS